MEKVLLELKKQVETLGILTTNSPENVREFLKRHNLEIFDFISSGRKLMGKSSNIKSILKTFSLKPSDFLYIGDESRDIVAAKKAGVNVAAVTWGLNTPDVLLKENPNHLINTSDELIGIIKNS
jgi:phosphoglycolate phosphatase